MFQRLLDKIWKKERNFSSKGGDRSGGRPLVGLALSSGGAKGLAHIGVIQVLEENGIEVDVIAGSSMGAYVGALWAYGYSGQEMETLAKELNTKKDLFGLIDPVFPPRKGFVSGYKVLKRIEKAIGDVSFKDLSKELRVVATNLDTLERVVFNEGHVASAVFASIAIPGVCVPVEMNGATYVDGGMCDPLPVDVLREMGVDKIIGVSTIPTPEEMQVCQLEAVGAKAEKQKAIQTVAGFMNRHLNYFAKGNVLDILLRSGHAAQIRIAHNAGERADVLLRAISCEGRWHDYTNHQKYIKLGREVAEGKIEKIKELLGSKG